MSRKDQNNTNSLVDEHTTTYENPFKFSAKELDDITGLYDHGARSRNPVSTLWYGVDPLWEKYVEMTPYQYCAWNPITYIDPTGCDSTKFKFSITVSVGAQFAGSCGPVEGEVNVGSVDLVSYQMTETGYDGNVTFEEFDYIGKNGGATIKNGINVSCDVPFVGEAKAGVENKFNTANPNKGEGFKPYADVDMAKFTYSFKFIIGLEIETNYDFTDLNTFIAILEYIKNLNIIEQE